MRSVYNVHVYNYTHSPVAPLAFWRRLVCCPSCCSGEYRKNIDHGGARALPENAAEPWPGVAAIAALAGWLAGWLDAWRAAGFKNPQGKGSTSATTTGAMPGVEIRRHCRLLCTCGVGCGGGVGDAYRSTRAENRTSLRRDRTLQLIIITRGVKPRPRWWPTSLFSARALLRRRCFSFFFYYIRIPVLNVLYLRLSRTPRKARAVGEGGGYVHATSGWFFSANVPFIPVITFW